MNITSTAREVIKPMNAVIYTRVSSDEQVSNFSLSSQEETCKNHAKHLGYEVLQVFKEEGASAKTLNRPELIKLLEYCSKNKKNIVSVIAYRIDRIARETSDYLAVRKKLSEYGIKLESVSEPTGDSPSSKFMETIFAAGAELDNSIRAEKSRVGLRKRFEAGLSCRPPLGYKRNIENTKLGNIIDPDTFEKTKEAWELMGTGTKTLSDMAQVMNDWGLRVVWAKKKKLITKQTCSRIFSNPYYYGIVKSKKYNEEVKGVHTPMISEELFFRVQGILAGRNKSLVSVKHRVNNPEFPLRGIVKCVCGKALVAGNVKGRNAHYPKYWCPKCTGVKSISTTDLEDKVVGSLRELQPTQGTINIFTMALRLDYDKVVEKLNHAKKEAEKQQVQLKQSMIALVEGHMAGLYPTDIFIEQKEKIENQMLAISITKNDSIIETYSIEGIVGFTKALWADLGKAYQVSDYSQRRILLGSIYPSGLIYDNGQLLNRNVSPIVRLDRGISSSDFNFVSLCVPKLSRIEPFFKFIQPLMLAYPNYKTQFAYATLD